jgi:hypothetical protein
MASAYKVILSTTEVVSWPAILEKASEHEQGKGIFDLHKGDDMVEEALVTDTLIFFLTGIRTH